MSDEKFEEFLQREAKAYNAPPPTVPRDEMWTMIARARAGRGAAGSSGVTPITRRKAPPRLRYAPWIGMAATLLVGIGIGRFALQRVDAGMTGAPAATVATGPSTRAPVPDAPSPSSTEVPAVSTPGTQAPPSAGTAAAPRASAPAVRPARTARSAARLASAPAPEAPAATAYQVASQRHLASAEALVSAVATTPRDAMIDSLTARWAREMLTNTRLLLDSPAGEDPIRRRLLEDLETLLVQLVQRSGAAVDERELIDRTLERTQLLTRLRSGAAGT